MKLKRIMWGIILALQIRNLIRIEWDMKTLCKLEPNQREIWLSLYRGLRRRGTLCSPQNHMKAPWLWKSLMRETHSNCQLQKLPPGVQVRSETSSPLALPSLKLKIDFLKLCSLISPSGQLEAQVKHSKVSLEFALANFMLPLSSSRLDPPSGS